MMDWLLHEITWRAIFWATCVPPFLAVCALLAIPAILIIGGKPK